MKYLYCVHFSVVTDRRFKPLNLFLFTFLVKDFNYLFWTFFLKLAILLISFISQLFSFSFFSLLLIFLSNINFSLNFVKRYNIFYLLNLVKAYLKKFFFYNLTLHNGEVYVCVIL